MPFVSASLLSLIPNVFFIIAQTINAVTKTNALIDITPKSCGPNDVSGLVIGTANVPQIPANKCAGIAPTTSSIFTDSSRIL